MTCQTVTGLAIRQGKGTPDVGHMKLPYPGRGDALGVHVPRRLPSISDLLRDVPLPPAGLPYGPAYPPSPLPSPISPSPYLYSSPYPHWSALPPRPRSVSDHSPCYLPPIADLGPRRASTGCLGTAARSGSYTGPSPGYANYQHHLQYRPTPDRDHTRQRRTAKQALRRRRVSSPHAALSPPPSPPAHTTQPSPQSLGALTLNLLPTTTTAKNNNNDNNRPHKTQKRNNTPYTFEQELFIIYHRVDLDMTWEQVRAAYMARWPALRRTTGAVQCEYYRTNTKVPAVSADGLLLLVDPEEAEAEVEGGRVPFGKPSFLGGASGTGSSFSENAAGSGFGSAPAGSGMGSGMLSPAGTPEAVTRRRSWWSDGDGRGAESWAEDEEEEEEGAAAEEGKGETWYKYYRGVAFRTRWVPCRRGKYSLMERFPEELVDEKNNWVREEHRVAARGIAERRRRQREEFLAAKARKAKQSALP